MTSTMCAAPGCSRPVGDAVVCAACRTGLDQALHDTPVLVSELNAALARQINQGVSVGRGGAETPLVVNLDAGRALDALTATLGRWVTQTAALAGRDAQRRAQRLPWHRPAALAGWLRGRTEILRHHPDAGRAFDDILGACDTGWRLVDLPANRTTFPVGPCPQLVDGLPCIGDVWVFIPRDRHTTATMSCTACESVWFPWQWSRAGQRILIRARERHATIRAGLAQVRGA